MKIKHGFIANKKKKKNIYTYIQYLTGVQTRCPVMVGGIGGLTGWDFYEGQ